MVEINLEAPEKNQPHPTETVSLAECAPVGTFASTKDFVVRIRNGKPAPANTGDQGGGQN